MGLAAVMACTGTVLPVLAGQASVAVDEKYVCKPGLLWKRRPGQCGEGL